MVISGLKEVHITNTSDPDWSDQVLLTNILEDGSFEQMTSSVMSSEGQHLTASVRTTFEFAHVDSDKMSQLETLSAAGTLIYLVAYGIDGHVQIWKPARIVATQTVEVKPGGLKKQTVKVQLDHVVTDFVQYSANLLPETFARGDSSTSITTESTGTTGAMASTTKNGSFTTGTNNILKITQSSAGTPAVTVISPRASWYWPIDGTQLPSFTIRSNEYNYSSGGSFSQSSYDILMYDSSASLIEALQVTTTTGLSSPGETVTATITDGYLFLFQTSIRYNTQPGTKELDNIGLYVGTTDVGFRV